MKLKFLSFLILFSFIGCNKSENSDPPSLSYEQRSAIMWADWGAGFASAELGPGSFLVGAAASASLYFNTISQMSTSQQQRISNFTFDTTYINDLERVGVDHNKVCKLYILDNNFNFNFNLFKQYAISVRPDLYEPLMLIEETYFNEIYNSILTVNYTNANSILNFIKSYIDLNHTDSQRLYNHITEILDYIDNEVIVEHTIDDIISEINTYSITQQAKERLLVSFYILKNSNSLWRN
jgi:hypothetical protein